MNFLQVSDTVKRVVDNGVQAPSSIAGTAVAGKLSFLDLLTKGGWVMVPIVFLLLLGIYIFIERYITIRSASKFDRNLLFQIRQYVLSRNVDAALALVRSNNSPVSRMLQKGLLRVGKPTREIEAAIENVGKLEVSKLESNISILGIIAGIAPMFGFVGTIVGVIKIFYNISLADNISIGLVADGLYQKMITSASGLVVGIFAYVGHHILNMMLDRVILRMETESIEFIDLLEEPVLQIH